MTKTLEEWDELLDMHEGEAWLFRCSAPGKHITYASIDKHDNGWWPVDQWHSVTRSPLGIIGGEVLIHSAEKAKP